MPEKSNLFIRAKARTILKGNWQLALLTVFIAGLPGLIASVVNTIVSNTTSADQLLTATALLQAGNAEQLLSFLKGLLGAQVQQQYLLRNILSVLSFLIAPMLELGMLSFFQKLWRQEGTPELKTVVSRAPSFLKAVGLKLLVALKTFLWSLPGLGALLLMVVLFTVSGAAMSGYAASWFVTLTISCYVGMIVPMVLAVLRYALARNFLADHPDWKLMDCIRESKKAMNGHKGSLFMMELYFFWMELAAALVSELMYYLVGYVGYMVVYQLLQLIVSVYMTCSICGFYETWRSDAKQAPVVEVHVA